MNPDQTPTPETTALYRLLRQGRINETDLIEKLSTLERQRDTARAEAKEAKEVVTSLLQNSDSLRAEVARLTKERDALRVAFAEASHNAGPAFVAHEELNLLRTELDTLRATRDADHGAAIEEMAHNFEGAFCLSENNPFVRELLRALVATVTNSQQKGGETPCAPEPKSISAPATPPSQGPQIPDAQSTGASNAAPTSNPEGAATPAEDARRLADRIVKHVENGIVYEVGASHVSIVRDVFEKWIREAIEHHAIQQATWHCDTLEKLEPATPSPTLERLAREIDDLYEAPSRIRPLRRILDHEFGASRSVSEAADEIMELPNPFRDDDKAIRRDLESILSGFREHELRALKAVLEQRTAEANLAVAVGENLQTQLESSQAELRELREENAKLIQQEQLVADALPTEFEGSEETFGSMVNSVVTQRDELREECGRLKFLINERHALLGYIESSRDINTRAVSSGCLDLNTWLVGLRKYAKDFDDAMQPGEEAQP